MSTAKLYRRSHDKLMREAEAKVDAIRRELDMELEKLAVQTFGTPNPAKAPLFAPPATPTRVHCWHCRGKYLSSRMRLEYRPRMQAVVVENLGQGLAALEPLWWCKNTDCDGAGLGHDLHPVTERKLKAAQP